MINFFRYQQRQQQQQQQQQQRQYRNFLFFLRTFFLDFDGMGFLSSLEQNFNPSKADIERRRANGKEP